MLLGFRELNLHANATNIEFELNFNARQHIHTHTNTHNLPYMEICRRMCAFVINKFVNKMEMQCGLLLLLAITHPFPFLLSNLCLCLLHTFCPQCAGTLLSLIHFVPSIMNLSAFCNFTYE